MKWEEIIQKEEGTSMRETGKDNREKEKRMKASSPITVSQFIKKELSANVHGRKFYAHILYPQQLL